MSRCCVQVFRRTNQIICRTGTRARARVRCGRADRRSQAVGRGACKHIVPQESSLGGKRRRPDPLVRRVPERRFVVVGDFRGKAWSARNMSNGRVHWTGVGAARAGLLHPLLLLLLLLLRFLWLPLFRRLCRLRFHFGVSDALLYRTRCCCCGGRRYCGSGP